MDCYLQHYCPKKILRVRYHGSNAGEKRGNAESKIQLNVNHIKNNKRKKGEILKSTCSDYLKHNEPLISDEDSTGSHICRGEN